MQFSGNGVSPTNGCWPQKTNVPGLSHGVVCMILGLAIVVEHPTCVRQTDRQTHVDGKYCASIVSHG